MRASSALFLLGIMGMLVACASSGRSEAEQALVFSDRAVPQCAFELAGEVSVALTMRGDRDMATRRLHTMLAQEATRQGADGIMNITLEAERVTVVAPAGTRPSDLDIPAVPWTGQAQAIRFVDVDCRG